MSSSMAASPSRNISGGISMIVLFTLSELFLFLFIIFSLATVALQNVHEEIRYGEAEAVWYERAGRSKKIATTCLTLAIVCGAVLIGMMG